MQEVPVDCCCPPVSEKLWQMKFSLQLNAFIRCRPQLGSQEQPGALEQDGPNRPVQGLTLAVAVGN